MRVVIAICAITQISFITIISYTSQYSDKKQENSRVKIQIIYINLQIVLKIIKILKI